ncbi:MAG: 3-deoxy-8-phosphooctulonate synthase [Candidatus Desantisbacteria bacterium]
MNSVAIGNIKAGEGLILIAGPCVIENPDITYQSASSILEITTRLQIPFIFKCSYDKANRSSIGSFRGPGLTEGLKVLSQIKKELNIPITTDVHCREDIDAVAEVADLIQIPAFLCRQTDLIVESAKARPINIKKGQFLSPYDMKYVVEKAESVNGRLLITERGTSFGYNNLIVDFRAFPIMRNFGWPVVFDATHSVAYPGGAESGGDRSFVPYLTRAAIACGANGLFMEVHPQPEKALSDGRNMVRLSDVEGILQEAKNIYSAFKP